MQVLPSKFVSSAKYLFTLLAFSMSAAGAWISTPRPEPGGFMGNHFQYLFGFYLWTFSIVGIAIAYLLNFPKREFFLFACSLFPIVFWGAEFAFADERGALVLLHSATHPMHSIPAASPGLVLVLLFLDKSRKRLPSTAFKISGWVLTMLIVTWLALLAAAVYVFIFKRIGI